MDIKIAFSKALKKARKSKKISQEAFSDTSSRTYISSLERAIKSPTLDKIVSLASTLKIHPLTLLTLAFMINESELETKSLFEKVNAEIEDIIN